MNKKNLITFAMGIICIFCLLMMTGCSTKSTQDPEPADKDFIQSMSKALESRWAMSTKDGKDGKEITVEMMNNYIQAELDELTPYESAVFEDTKLQEKVIKYINCLKDSKEHIEYYYSDDFKEYEKWTDIYNTRSILIKDFAENYGLTVSEKYRNTLDGFLTNGKSVEAQDSKDKAIKKLVDSLKFKQVESNYDYKTYQATLENTSNYNIKSISVDISLLNAEGTILDTEYASAKNISKGKKAILEFITNEKFDKIEVILDYYEAN
ncbi:MAG: FxLYD domain-containing protein [Ruminococcus sp.]|nr:FxLYD domain-containing protein [Ruminococcus sp.]